MKQQIDLKTKLLCVLLCVCMAGSLLCLPSMGVHAVSEFGYTDGNRMSDEEFFGRWNSETQEWEVSPKFNYAYNNEMGFVEQYVKEGDLETAREVLFNYYKKRDPKYPVSLTRSSALALVLRNRIIPCETPVIGVYSVSATPQWYSYNVTGSIKGGFYCFLFQSLDRDLVADGEEEIISFNAKESGANTAQLVLKVGSSDVVLDVKEDMYLRGGNYIKVPYGKEEQVLVSEDGSSANGNGTRQGYFKFDLSGIDVSQVTSATLRVYGSSTQDNKRVALFVGRETTWNEETACTNNTTRRVFSYHNIEIGDWQNFPVGHYAQYVSVMRRLQYLPTLYAETAATGDVSFAKAAIELELDFIANNGGMYYGNCDVLTSSFRESAMYSCFYAMLNSPAGDSTAFMSMLKFIWQEAYWNCQPENEYRNHNVTAGQNTLILNACIYFPEFALNPDWVTVAAERYERMAEDLCFADGDYIEGTSGYDVGVFDSFSKIYEQAASANIELTDKFRETYRKFAFALIAMSTPEKGQFQWGDGGASGNLRSNIKKAADLLDDDELLYYATDGKEGTPISFTSKLLPESKRASMRDNWTDNGVSAMMIGFSGRNHGHSFGNSMSLYAYGRLLFGLYGVLSYDVSQGWNYYLMYRQRSQNTVEINGIGGIKTGNGDISMNSNQRMDHFTNTVDVYKDLYDRDHTRQVTFIKNNKKFYIVSDFLNANGREDSALYDQAWTPLADANLTLDEDTKIAKTNFQTGANVAFIPADPSTLTKAFIDDGYSKNLNGQKMEGKLVSYQIEKTGNAKFNTIIYPFEGKASDTIRTAPIEVIGDSGEQASAFSATLPDGNKMVYYINQEPEKKKSYGIYDATAQMAYVEKNTAEEIKFLSASNFSSLKENGRDILTASRTLSDISVEYTGNVTNIYTSDVLNLNTEYLIVHSNKNEKVALNGEEVPYLRLGDSIVIGTYSIKPSDLQSIDGKKAVVLPDGLSIGYPVKDKTSTYWAYLNFEEGTTLSSGDINWNGKIALEYPEEGNGNKDNYGTILFKQLEADRPVQFHMAKSDGWRISVGTASGTLSSFKEIAENSYDAADDAANTTVMALYKGEQDSYIYTKQLGNMRVYLTSDIVNEEGESTKPGDPTHVKTPAPTASSKPVNGGGTGGGGIGGGGTESTPSTSPSSTPPAETPRSFPDTTGHWAEETVTYMADNGYINGYEDGSFRPDNQITRAEFAAILARILGGDTPYQGSFADVSASAWYAGAVQCAYEAGIVSGDGVNFYPEHALKRGELAKMAVGLYQKLAGPATETADAGFTDSGEFEEWEREAINAAYQLGFIKGMPDGSFQSKEPTTRAETAEILFRLLRKAGKTANSAE